MVQNVNIIDLFSGCGGLSLGFEMAGYKTLLGVDNDRTALKTFEYNHNAEAICGDITNITGEDIRRAVGDELIDVIVGGPPCQGMSISGPRKFHDPRNKLYLSYIRLVDELKPKAFVIENVPGLVSLFGGKIKESILEEFSKMGYNVSCRIMNAAQYGVPQTRRRVIFVGLRGDTMFEFPKPLHVSESDYVTTEEAIGDLPLLDALVGEDEESYVSKPQNEFQRLCRINASILRNHEATSHKEQTKRIISLVPEGGNYKDLPEEYRETRNFHVAWTRYHSKKPALTIDTGHRHHFHYKANRVPTVRENARFQSFPDDFVFLGNRTEQYRQVGNAVPPLLAKAIAEQLMKYLVKEETVNAAVSDTSTVSF